VQTGLQEIFWLPGVGDHGGGPSRDMLEVAAKWQRSPFFPQIEFSSARDYLENLAQRRRDAEEEGGEGLSFGGREEGFAQRREDAKEEKEKRVQSSFPVWRDELYLELHRGCYTVHGDQKRYNRRCERLLYEAELWSTLAILLCGEGFYFQSIIPQVNAIIEPDICSPKNSQQLIAIAWKKVLFNQFHDILPGTSIAEVFTEANRDWETVIRLGECLLRHALDTIALNIKLPESPQFGAIPVVVFNSLNWKRSQIVTLEDPMFNEQSLFWLWDDRGNRISANNNQPGKLSFLAQDIPGVGYSLYWWCSALGKKSQSKFSDQYQLENSYLKVVVNPDTGDLDSIFDKGNEREILRSPGNKLQAFTDQGQYWDAWNIDPEYEQKPLADTELKSIEWLEDNELRQVIRVVKQLNCSEFIQDYILESQANLLKIKNTVDWQETHVMVKVAFPLNLRSDRVTYEIPCGTIERNINPQTLAEQAQWEVPALHWADLTDTKANYGVSLLNDCKYGYDAQPDQLRLTLLRAATWPDPKSDRGIHHFSYGIYPHQCGWQEAHTVRKGYEFNTALQAIVLDPSRVRQRNPRQLSPRKELLNLGADNLVLMALQLSERQDLSLRCYEALGIEAQIEVRSDLNIELGTVIDCLGEKQAEPARIIKPHKIMTYQVNRFSEE
jgi:alpha-mannosidase